MAQPHVDAPAAVVTVKPGIGSSTVRSPRLPPVVLPVLNRGSANAGLLSQQQGANQGARADGPK
jgi:hypothetical protein